MHGRSLFMHMSTPHDHALSHSRRAAEDSPKGFSELVRASATHGLRHAMVKGTPVECPWTSAGVRVAGERLLT
jgi:hypothetical protein